MNGSILRLPILRPVFLIVAVTVGCRGEVPKPANSPNQSAQPAVAHEAPTKSAEQKTTEPAFVVESGFELLTLEQFDALKSEPETWAAKEEGLKCSGKPKGYLYSKTPYKNFTWRLEYRFPRPDNLKDEAKFKGNTGFLVYIQSEQKVWPVCIEVQGKHVQMAAIKENGVAPGSAAVVTKDDEAARQQARHSVGEWNQLEIISTAGALQVSLNGTPISSSEPFTTNINDTATTLEEGFIGIQAEDHPFEVRRMRIQTN